VTIHPWERSLKRIGKMRSLGVFRLGRKDKAEDKKREQ